MMTKSHSDKKGGGSSTPCQLRLDMRWQPPGSSPSPYTEAFEKWWKRYPNKQHKQAVKPMWLRIAEKFGAEILEKALTGYINFKLDQADKFGRDPDPQYCMYPETFLRKNRWREYLDYKRRPPRW